METATREAAEVVASFAWPGEVGIDRYDGAFSITGKEAASFVKNLRKSGGKNCNLLMLNNRLRQTGQRNWLRSSVLAQTEAPRRRLAVGRRVPDRTMVAAGRGGRRGCGRHPVAIGRDIVSDGLGRVNVGGRARVRGSWGGGGRGSGWCGEGFCGREGSRGPLADR